MLEFAILCNRSIYECGVLFSILFKNTFDNKWFYQTQWNCLNFLRLSIKWLSCLFCRSTCIDVMRFLKLEFRWAWFPTLSSHTRLWDKCLVGTLKRQYFIFILCVTFINWILHKWTFVFHYFACTWPLVFCICTMLKIYVFGLRTIWDKRVKKCSVHLNVTADISIEFLLSLYFQIFHCETHAYVQTENETVCS